MRTKKEISEIVNIDIDQILNVYAYGSEVYGTWAPGSDEDYIIVRSGSHATDNVREGEIDVTIYDVEHFQRKVDAHYISNLECIFLPIHLKYESHSFSFTLDLAKLRCSISESCNISFDKCKKRLIPGNPFSDPYGAKKSLWHALRISAYGKQIAISGRITDYGVVNGIRDKILNLPDNWEEISLGWKAIYNLYMSEFRAVAPK